MSTSPMFEGTSQHPDCDPTARVFIGEGQIEVPVVNGEDGDQPAVETQHRTTGAADSTSISDCNIPMEWGKRDVLGAILDATGADSLGTIGNDPVRIDIRDEITNEYVPVHYGPIWNLGPSSLTDCIRFMVGDYTNYFDTISFDTTFDRRSTAINVLQAVVDRVEQHEGLPSFGVVADDGERQLPIDLGPVEAARQAQAENDGIGESISDTLTGGDLEATTKIAAPKSFHGDLHTCADALQWLCQVTNSCYWVGYDSQNERPVLVYTQDPSGPSLNGINLADNGEKYDVRVLQNNALYELSPQRCLSVVGQKLTEREYPKEDPIELSNTQLTTTVRPMATAQHKGLVERAGENPHPEIIRTDATSIDVAEKQAKRRLRSRIEGAAGGEVVALPTAYARPRATIEALPACSDRLDRDVNPLTYQVNEVIHRVASPTVKNSQGPRTLLRCGVEVSDDDLVITESKQVDVSNGQ